MGKLKNVVWSLLKPQLGFWLVTRALKTPNAARAEIVTQMALVPSDDAKFAIIEAYYDATILAALESFKP